MVSQPIHHTLNHTLKSYSQIYICDYDCNYDNNNNPNDCVQDIFHYEIEKAIDSGNINLIKNAITNYQHLIDKSYIIWANNIMFQMVQEQIENITLCLIYYIKKS